MLLNMRDRKSIRGGAGNPTKLSDFICSDPRIQSASDDDSDSDAHNTASSATDSPGYSSDHFKTSVEGSPYSTSPWSAASASPWLHSSTAAVSPFPSDLPPNAALLASLVRSEGHVYSLAASGDLLYTGSESKNIRVWKHHREFAGFKSGSGFVKAIVISNGKIFTGHHDGKIRVWRRSQSASDPSAHRQIGTLPRLKDYLKSSINPSSYVEARRGRRMWLRHSDAVSCLSLDEEGGVLYSGSWDRTVKVWRISDSRCLESIAGHDDAVNSVAAAPGGVVFTGSADGTVKMWRREAATGRHAAVETLMEQESAVTALAVGGGGEVVYCGSSDGAVRWWEMRGGRVSPERGWELRGHRMAVLCLATAGRVVVSGSADKTLCVWRRNGAEHVRLVVLAGHGGPVKCLAVEDGDGEGPWMVYSGSLDKTVRVWRVAAPPVAAPPVAAHVMHVRGRGPA